MREGVSFGMGMSGQGGTVMMKSDNTRRAREMSTDCTGWAELCCSSCMRSPLERTMVIRRAPRCGNSAGAAVDPIFPECPPLALSISISRRSALTSWTWFTHDCVRCSGALAAWSFMSSICPCSAATSSARLALACTRLALALSWKSWQIFVTSLLEVVWSEFLCFRLPALRPPFRALPRAGERLPDGLGLGFSDFPAGERLCWSRDPDPFATDSVSCPASSLGGFAATGSAGLESGSGLIADRRALGGFSPERVDLRPERVDLARSDSGLGGSPSAFRVPVSVFVVLRSIGPDDWASWKVFSEFARVVDRFIVPDGGSGRMVVWVGRAEPLRVAGASGF